MTMTQIPTYNFRHAVSCCLPSSQVLPYEVDERVIHLDAKGNFICTTSAKAALMVIDHFKVRERFLHYLNVKFGFAIKRALFQQLKITDLPPILLVELFMIIERNGLLLKEFCRKHVGNQVMVAHRTLESTYDKTRAEIGFTFAGIDLNERINQGPPLLESESVAIETIARDEPSLCYFKKQMKHFRFWIFSTIHFPHFDFQAAVRVQWVKHGESRKKFNAQTLTHSILSRQCGRALTMADATQISYSIQHKITHGTVSKGWIRYVMANEFDSRNLNILSPANKSLQITFYFLNQLDIVLSRQVIPIIAKYLNFNFDLNDCDRLQTSSSWREIPAKVLQKFWVACFSPTTEY